MSYNAFITRIKNVRKHSNADRLQVGECFGNQVIIDLNTKEEDIGIYFPTDGRLSKEFLEANNLIGKTDPTTGKRVGGYFDERGKVRTQKFRKEVSDGFFCPIEYLSFTKYDLLKLKEGMQFTEINGIKICEKYIAQSTKSYSGKGNKKKKTLFHESIQYPCFHEHKDTEQLAYNLNQLKENDVLIITTKVHGTSARSSYSLQKKFNKFSNIINDIFKKEVIKAKTKYEYIYGTRRVLVKNENTFSGFYKKEDFRKKAHELFKDKLQKGETIYYEIVGYVDEQTLIMPECSNDKMDKDFIKKYGHKTTFNYGCIPGESKVYVYRISMTNEDGYEIDYSWNEVKRRCEEMAVNHVLEDKKIIYNGNKKELMDMISKMVEGEDPIGKTHIKEGVVVRIDGSKWKAYKHKGILFKILEGIIKDSEKVDIEEVEDLKKEQEI